MIRVHEIDVLETQMCGGILTNYGATADHCVLLPGLQKALRGPICFIGAAPYEMAFEAIQTGTLLGVDGEKTIARIPAEHCVGSTTTFVQLFGGAWHVSSNVPLVFD